MTLPRLRSAGESTIERIRKRDNQLQVGVTTDQAPFTYQDNNGSLIGFDIDLWRALAEQWQVTVEFVPLAAGERLASLRSGEVDLLASGMQRIKEQEADLNFSQTYYVGGANLLSKPEAAIQSISDLNNRAVAVLQGTTLGDQLQALADANGVIITVVEQPTYETALTELRQGNVAALLAESSALAQFTNNSTEWSVLSNLLDATPYSFGLPAADSYFNNLVNATLQQLQQSGTYDELYRKWFGAETAPYALEVLPGQWPYSFADSPTTVDTPSRSKVEEIQQRGRLVAGVPFDLVPFGSVATAADTSTQPSGFDVALVQELAKRWLGDPQAIDFVAVTAGDGPQKLASGAVDLVAAALPHHLEAEELINFSQAYYRGQQALLMRTDEQITALAALNNKTLAAIQGTPAVAQLQALANREGIGLNLLPFQEFSAAYAALQTKQVDGIVGLQAVLERLSVSESGLVVLTGLFPSQAYAIGLPNHDERFQDLINFTLQEIKQDGTYDRIYQQWLGGSEPFALELWPGTSYLDLDMIPMVRVAAGEYTRGNLYGFPDERIEKTIFLDEFYIDQYEVTNRQYAACVRAGRCNLPRLPRSVNFANYYAASEFGNYPVIWVSWQDAADYCAYRGKRLPTEAEWEKAARGPSNALYPWGKAEPTTESNFNYSVGDASAVGSFPQDRSEYGVYDMGGNVREWVADWYQWDYYLTGVQNNPLGPDTGVTRVLRGGSWNDVAIYARATSRKNFLPESYDSNLGFRCTAATFPPSKD
jgi:ABC-type amino acid transport substrate-binding protein